MDVSERFFLTLTKPVTPEVLIALRERAAAALEQGVKTLTIDVDAAGVLDSSVLAALIGILRAARERGGSVELRASRATILDTLRITALDKVFTVAASPAVPAPVLPSRRPARRGLAAALFAGAFAAGSLLGARASTAADEAPRDLVKAVVDQNAPLQSYRARVSVDMRLRSFPYIAQHLDGVTYFKRPDNFELTFHNVPSYAKGFDKLYSDIDDPTNWERRFEMSLVGERAVNGHRDVVIRLVQKVRGMIDHEDVTVDPLLHRIDSMEWHYYNGGLISMTQEYQRTAGFSVLSKQHATIRIPFVHAAADATYSGYETNVAIDDGVFTRDKH